MTPFLLALVVCAVPVIAQTQDYSFTKIADDGPNSPYFRIEEAGAIYLNNRGEVLFSAPAKPDGIRRAIRARGEQHTTIWDSAAASSVMGLNDAGEALLGFSSPFPGSLRIGSGGALRVVAEGIEFDGFSARLNNAGAVAFRSGYSVLYRLPNGTLQTLLPESELPRSDPSSRVQINMGGMNDSGTVVVSGGREGSGTGTLLHTKGPDGLKRIPYESFGFVSPDINNRGELAWSVAENSRTAIYQGSVGGVSRVLVDDFDTELNVGTHPQIGNRGEILYRATVRRTGIAGLYVYSGGRSAKVIAIGDSLFGSPVSELSMLGSGLTRTINDTGQIAFYFRNREVRGIAVATPAAAGQQPAISPSGVVDAASFQPSISPGAIVSLFGERFAPVLTVSEGAPLPVALGGVRVTFNGVDAPLFFTSAGQANVQAPFELTGSTAEVRVTNPNGTSETQRVSLAAQSPAMFTLTQNGRGQAIAVFADTGALVAPPGTAPGSRPARPGEIITLYSTGLGAVTPPIATGANSCSESRCLPDLSNLMIRRCVVNPAVTIGGVRVADGDVLFCGLAPQFVGLYQINLRVPSGVPPGNVQSVVITQGTNSSPAEVYIALQ